MNICNSITHSHASSSLGSTKGPVIWLHRHLAAESTVKPDRLFPSFSLLITVFFPKYSLRQSRIQFYIVQLGSQSSESSPGDNQGLDSRPACPYSGGFCARVYGPLYRLVFTKVIVHCLLICSLALWMYTALCWLLLRIQSYPQRACSLVGKRKQKIRKRNRRKVGLQLDRARLAGAGMLRGGG